MKNRAYSRFEIKSISDELREFSGIASAPTVDLQGDVLDPLGARYTLPLPCLWQHDSARPIGWITKATPTAVGITVTGKIATVDSPPSLRDSLDFAWSCVKSKLVRGLSVGFRVLEERATETGYHITSWLLLEVSCVTIAANQSASITEIRAADLRSTRGSALSSSAQRELLARMSGRADPGVAMARRTRLMRERAEAHMRAAWRCAFPD